MTSAIRRAARRIPGFTLLFVLSFSGLRAAHAEPASALLHDTISGGAIDVMDLASPDGRTESVAFADLEGPRPKGTYSLVLKVRGKAARVPHCNGRKTVSVDGAVRDRGSNGPLLLSLGDDREHDLRVEVTVSTYEKRIACGERVRVGDVARESEGLFVWPTFSSPHKGPMAGTAVVFIPRGHDVKSKGALLVGLHPWNGSPWTYAAYRELLEEAQAKDVVLLMPSGLGNSLYTADAEDEVMRAIEAVSREIAIDKQRISLWGASMGGQGATTVGFHRPDKFAFVASFFGDAKFDVSTYVRSILPSESAAHKVNPLDVIDNARHIPLWLIHGQDDRTSPIVQSELLFAAMKKRGFQVDFDRVPGVGHEAPLVAKFLRRVVDRAECARAPRFPPRVTFRSTRATDTEAYGVRLVRDGEQDAYIDIEKRESGVFVLGATRGVTELVLLPGALGASESDAFVVDPSVHVTVRRELAR